MATPTSQSSARSVAPAIPLLTDRAYDRIKHNGITCVLAPGSEVFEPPLCLHYRLGKAPVWVARLLHPGLGRRNRSQETQFERRPWCCRP